MALPTELHYLTIGEAAPLIASGELSPVELTRAYLARIDAVDGQLDSYVTITSELALSQARQVDFDAVLLQHVHHVGQHRDRLAALRRLPYHLQGEVEAFFQPGHIDQAQHMRDQRIVQGLPEVTDGKFFLTGNGLQRIGAGKIHQGDLGQSPQLAGTGIHGTTRKVGDLVQQSGEAVEQQALAGIGTADQQHLSPHSSPTFYCERRYARYKPWRKMRPSHVAVGSPRCGWRSHRRGKTPSCRPGRPWAPPAPAIAGRTPLRRGKIRIPSGAPDN